jgi:hypothetical protein
MKRLLLTLLFLAALAAYADAQTVAQKQGAEREKSNIEKFSEKSGTLFEKTFINVGTVKDVKVQVMVISDMMSNSKVSGVRFEVEKSTRYSSDTKVAFLDKDEVDGLIKSLGILKSSVLNTTRDSYTEVEFRSRSGFSAGAFYSDGKWSAFMKLERFDSNSYVFLRPEDFDALAGLLQQAKAQLV